MQLECTKTLPGTEFDVTVYKNTNNIKLLLLFSTEANRRFEKMQEDRKEFQISENIRKTQIKIFIINFKKHAKHANKTMEQTQNDVQKLLEGLCQ